MQEEKACLVIFPARGSILGFCVSARLCRIPSTIVRSARITVFGVGTGGVADARFFIQSWEGRKSGGERRRQMPVCVFLARVISPFLPRIESLRDLNDVFNDLNMRQHQ